MAWFSDSRRKQRRPLLLLALTIGLLLWTCLTPELLQQPASLLQEATVVTSTAAGSGDSAVLSSRPPALLIDELAPLHGAVRTVSRYFDFLQWPVTTLLRVFTAPTTTTKEGGSLFRVDHGDFRPYRKWHVWLDEICFVVGLSDPASGGEGRGGGRLRCPELWVDESWPRGTATAPKAARTMTVSSTPVLVLQAKITRQLPEDEVKAQIGFVIAQLVWRSPALSCVQLPHLYVIARSVQSIWGSSLAKVFPEGIVWKLQELSSSPLLRTSGVGSPWQQTQRTQQRQKQRQQAQRNTARTSSSMQSVMELRTPWLLAPLVRGAFRSKDQQGGLGTAQLEETLARHRKDSAARIGQWLSTAKGMRPKLPKLPELPELPELPQFPALELGLPALAKPVQDVAALSILAGLAGVRTRTGVFVADRVAAVACGDAEIAAAGLLRTYGLLQKGVSSTHRQQALLQKVVAQATEHELAWRAESVLRLAREPRVELRVKALLDWSKSEAGKRVLAVGATRRKDFQRKSLSPLQSVRSGIARQEKEAESQRKGEKDKEKTKGILRRWLSPLWSWWDTSTACRCMLLCILMAPCTRWVDPLRWAVACSLSVTLLGLLSPLHSPALFSSSSLAALVCSLLIYVLILGSIWWNHLLGGSARWSRLNADFATDVAEQANATASVFYLTKHWAEMAKRSMAHLDEELCGSWRCSVHELATKLNDLWHELQACSPASTPNTTSQDQGLLEGGGGGASTLWLKVDSAVQEALQVESARIKFAQSVDDTETLRAMMAWFMIDADQNGHVAGVDGIEEPTETLGKLLLTEQLHPRYCYHSFHNTEDGGIDLNENEDWPEANHFQRLESEVSQNFLALEDLRGQMSSWQDARTALFWTYADIRRMCGDYQRAIWGVNSSQMMGKDVNGMSGISIEDQQKEFVSLSCLILAVISGSAVAIGCALQHHWSWIFGGLIFGAANAVLLLNYSKLRLPHVHRRFSQRLRELRMSREQILTEMQSVQRASQRGGVQHLRACISWQSVNVLRNINYVASCVKAQAQRAAAEDRPWEQRRHVALCGLQMLLTLLPRRGLEKADILAADDCNLALAVLHEKSRGMTLGSLRSNVLLWREFATMRRRVLEAQRNMWLLFRMVHFSSAIPAEEHGQMKALLERFIRPVLLEGRVPLGTRPDMLGVKGGNGSRNSRGKDSSASSSKGSRRTMEASARGNSFCSESSFTTLSGKSTVDSEQNPLETMKMLHRLTATRADIANVLMRLPPAALVDASLATCPPTGAIFTDVFSSIIVGLIPSFVPAESRAPSSDHIEPIGFALGFSHGDNEYTLEGGIRTTLLLRVMCARPAAQEWEAHQFAVPLSAITAEEPSKQALETAWHAVQSRLCLADGRLGDSALKARRRSLRRAKDVLRSLGGRRA